MTGPCFHDWYTQIFLSKGRNKLLEKNFVAISDQFQLLFCLLLIHRMCLLNEAVAYMVQN